VAAAIDGKIAAPAELEGLFLAHHARALKAAYRITGSMSDAEDVAQAVFLRILQQGACRQAIDNPESYIYRAAINAALDLLRKRRREAAVPVEEASETGTSGAAERDSEAGELREWLRRALANLSPTAAEMFVLRYVEDYDNGQIARLMKTSRAVVAVVLYRARARLRNEFRSYMRGTR
jgi:RNA polymerase sigma factor (sigma-70 family)